MDDGFSDENEYEPQTQDAPPAGGRDAAYWESQAKKAFEARDQARQELRTTIQAGYDPEIVKMIPQSLPINEWKDLADNISSLRGKEAPVTPEDSSREPEPEVEVPAETLAGIVNGPSGSASGGSGHVAYTEWQALVASDPAEAERLFKAEKVDFSNLRQGLGPDR
jgi:hypothetical protein